MSIGFDPENYAIINWQYFDRSFYEQNDGYYSDEHCSVRESSIFRYINAIMDSAKNNNPTKLLADCQKGKEYCLEKAVNIFNSRNISRVQGGIALFRIAYRIDTLYQEINNHKSIEEAFSPYKLLQYTKPTPLYVFPELFFSVESKNKDKVIDAVIKSLETISQIHIFFELIDFINKHKHLTPKELCELTMELIRKNTSHQRDTMESDTMEVFFMHTLSYNQTIFTFFKDNKIELLEVLLEKENLEWLIEKNVFSIVKDNFPNDKLQILQKEEEFLRIKRRKKEEILELENKIQEHKFSLENSSLREARSTWIEYKSRMKSEINEGKVAESKAVESGKISVEVAIEFICPITQELMRDPVVTREGQMYEKKAIELWLRKNTSDPITRGRLSEEDLFPVHPIRNFIERTWLENT